MYKNVNSTLIIFRFNIVKRPFDTFQDICPLLSTQAQAAAPPPEEDPELPTAKDVCVAYCSMAEIYLTDLWYWSSHTVDTYNPISCYCFGNDLRFLSLSHSPPVCVCMCVRACACVCAAWKRDLQTSAESSLREHYSITMTTLRLYSSWQVTCSVQRETRSVHTHTDTHTDTHRHTHSG